MSKSPLAHLLSVSLLLPLALGVTACAGEAAKGDGKGDKAAAKTGDKAEDKAEDKADAPIAGAPVEGEGKVGVEAGGAEEAKEYALEIDPADATVGAESKVSIRLVPQGEWHMNLEYPTKLEITAPEGTTVAKPKLAKGDAIKLDEAGCEFAVGFTPDSAGSKKFTGEFKFAICREEACVPRTETLEFEVAVK